MQDIAIILGSLAGVATAAVAIRISSRGNRAPDAPHATEEARHLEIERDIITKTIARLYEPDSGLTRIQRDGLLIKYQRQMEAIQIKMQRLKHTGSSKEVDGGVGDLMIRVDEKLSRLDERIYELSSSMAETNLKLLESSARMRTQEPLQDESTRQDVTSAKISVAVPAGMPAGMHATPPAEAPVVQHTVTPDMAPPAVPAGTPTKKHPKADQTSAGNAPKGSLPLKARQIKPMPQARIIKTDVKPKKEPPEPKPKERAGISKTAKLKTDVVPDAGDRPSGDKTGKNAPLGSHADIPEIEEPVDDIDDAEELKKIKDDINKALTKLAQTEVE